MEFGNASTDSAVSGQFPSEADCSVATGVTSVEVAATLARREASSVNSHRSKSAPATGAVNTEEGDEDVKSAQNGPASTASESPKQPWDADPGHLTAWDPALQQCMAGQHKYGSDLGGGWAKFGDFSVEQLYTSLDPMFMHVRLDTTTGGYIAMLLSLIRENNPRRIFANLDVGNGQAWCACTILTRSNNKCSTPAEAAPGIWSHNRPTTAVTDTRQTVNFGFGRIEGWIDKSLLDKFYLVKDVTNFEVFAGALKPIFKAGDREFMRHLAYEWDAHLEVCDNMMMYAKLLWYAAIVDLVPQVTGHGALHPSEAYKGFSVDAWINQNAAGNQIAAYTWGMTHRCVWLIQEVDFESIDWHIFYMLGSTGISLESAAGSRTLDALSMEWPAIPLGFIAQGDAPALPIAGPAAHLTSQQIHEVIVRLANSRREWPDVHRAMYWVSENIGYRQVGINDPVPAVQPHPSPTYPLNAWGLRSALRLPHPGDYSPVLRLLQILPQAPQLGKDEVLQYFGCSQMERARILCAFSSIQAALTSTLWISNNISRTNLLDYFGAGRVAPENLAGNLHGMLESPDGGFEAESLLALTVRAAASKLIGANWPDRLYGLAALNSTADTWDVNFVAAYENSTTPNHVPMTGSLLGIDGYLLERPAEWGLPVAEAKVSFKADKWGWYALRECSKYGEASAQEEDASTYIPYGLLALNCIAQWKDDDTAFQVHVVHSDPVLQGHNTSWHNRFHYQNIDWKAELRTFRPGSLFTYSWAGNVVYAPEIIVQANFDQDSFENLGRWTNEEGLRRCGVPLLRMQSVTKA